MTKKVDLDAARRARTETQEEPVVATLGGVDYELPPSLPAIVLIGVGRLQRGQLDGFEDVLEGMFGAKWEEAVKGGFDLDDLELLLAEVYDLGEAPASPE